MDLTIVILPKVVLVIIGRRAFSTKNHVCNLVIWLEMLKIKFTTARHIKEKNNWFKAYKPYEFESTWLHDKRKLRKGMANSVHSIF